MKFLEDLSNGSVVPNGPLYSRDLGVAAHPQAYSENGNFSDFPEAYLRYTQGDVGRALDFGRIWSLVLNCEQALTRIEGSVAEIGVHTGQCGALLSFYAEKYRRKMYLCDTFVGFAEAQYEEDFDERKRTAFKDVSLESATRVVGDYSGNRWVVGMFPDSVTHEMRNDRFAFVSIDCDIYEPIRQGMEFFWPRMDVGGMIFIHDYGSGYWPGATRAVDEFCHKHKVAGCVLSDMCGTYALAKSTGG